MSGPSHWHGEAKDAGHDEMVLAVLRKVNAVKKITASIDHFNGAKPTEFTLLGTEAEFVVTASDFKGGERVAAFVDIFARYGIEIEGGKQICLIAHAYEVKPVIRSAGAIVRQCKAIRVLLGNRYAPNISIRVAVYRDDPKVDQLIEMMGERRVVLCDRP